MVIYNWCNTNLGLLAVYGAFFANKIHTIYLECLIMTGKDLAKIRYGRKWKATWLAKQLGCCRQTIRNYEKKENEAIPKAMALAVKALLLDY